MTSERMQNWDLGDYHEEFRRLAEGSRDAAFRERFGALADAIEPLTREFVRETAGCGHDLGGFLQELAGIAARDRYCDRPRGFEETCDALYGDVDAAIRKAEELRGCCFQ
jgi:hypothetical protein